MEGSTPSEEEAAVEAHTAGTPHEPQPPQISTVPAPNSGTDTSSGGEFDTDEALSPPATSEAYYHVRHLRGSPRHVAEGLLRQLSEEHGQSTRPDLAESAAEVPRFEEKRKALQMVQEVSGATGATAYALQREGVMGVPCQFGDAEDNGREVFREFTNQPERVQAHSAAVAASMKEILDAWAANLRAEPREPLPEPPESHEAEVIGGVSRSKWDSEKDAMSTAHVPDTVDPRHRDLTTCIQDLMRLSKMRWSTPEGGGGSDDGAGDDGNDDGAGSPPTQRDCTFLRAIAPAFMAGQAGSRHVKPSWKQARNFSSALLPLGLKLAQAGAVPSTRPEAQALPNENLESYCRAPRNLNQVCAYVLAASDADASGRFFERLLGLDPEDLLPPDV